jgi:hypothetical protein
MQWESRGTRRTLLQVVRESKAKRQTLDQWQNQRRKMLPASFNGRLNTPSVNLLSYLGANIVLLS